MEGTILVPNTRRRTSPKVRTNSPASPHACVVATFSGRFIGPLNSGLRGFPAVTAATLGSKNLAASKRRPFENRLEPEGRSLVRLLRTRFTRLARRIHVHHVRHVL